MSLDNMEGNLGIMKLEKKAVFLVKITNDKSNTVMYIYFGIFSERAANIFSD